MKRRHFAAAVGAAAFIPGTPRAAAGAAADAPTRSGSISDGPIWSGEYSARKGTVKLAMYRKRVVPAAGGAALPVLFLVHGSSMAGRSTFDLTVPCQTGYSMMDEFARRGYDVWAMDHEGYGRSDRTSGN
ncbi:MAG: lysophospholipase, partial [Candidatus Eremiobacteraeota bacterium]|nr:lysophospholipase [Candidatus Eremiobacteraeota bacterium]